MTRKFWIGGLAAIFAGVLAVVSPVYAGPIYTFGFTGTVTSVGQNLGLFGSLGGVSINDPFSGQFSYEIGAANPDQDPGNVEVGRYNLTAFTIVGAVAAITPTFILVEHEPPGSAIPPATAPPGGDRIFVIVDVAGYQSGALLALFAPYQTFLSDDSLPTDLILSDFTERAVLASRETAIPPTEPLSDVGMIESLSLISVTQVPEPGTLALFGFGLLGFGVMTRRRRETARVA